MPLPAGLQAVTVTGTFLGITGLPLAGTVSLTPSAPVQDPAGNVVVSGTARVCPLSGGSFSAVVAATDTAGLSPAGWSYTVGVAIEGQDPWSFSCFFPHSPSPVDLSALT